VEPEIQKVNTRVKSVALWQQQGPLRVTVSQQCLSPMQMVKITKTAQM